MFPGQRRGQAWKDHVEEAARLGKVATTASDFAREVAKRDALIDQLKRIESCLPDLARKIISGGTKYERTILFEFLPMGGGKAIPAKARLDIMYDSDDGLYLIADLKTTSGGVSLRDVSNASAQYFYDLQGAFYLQAAMSLSDNWSLDMLRFNWIFIESSEPYDVGIYNLGEKAYNNGLSYLWDSLQKYVDGKKGLIPGQWIGEVQDIEIPQYHLFEPSFANLEEVAL